MSAHLSAGIWSCFHLHVFFHLLHCCMFCAQFFFFILLKIATINNAPEGFKVILTYQEYATTQIACQEQKASPVPQQTCAKNKPFVSAEKLKTILMPKENRCLIPECDDDG